MVDGTTGEHGRWDPRTTHVALPGTANLRDLGGTPAADGRVVASIGSTERRPSWIPVRPRCARPGTRRIPGPTRPSASGRCSTCARAVRWRRSDRPGRRRPAPPTFPCRSRRAGRATPTTSTRSWQGERRHFGAEDLAAYYGRLLERRTAEFGAALRVLADPARLPVLVQCAAGKDRTGLLVALTLEALGSPRTVVVDEYALTGVLRPGRVLAYAHLFEGSGVDLADVAPLFDAPAEAWRRPSRRSTTGTGPRSVTSPTASDSHQTSSTRSARTCSPRASPRR